MERQGRAAVANRKARWPDWRGRRPFAPSPRPLAAPARKEAGLCERERPREAVRVRFGRLILRFAWPPVRPLRLGGVLSSRDRRPVLGVASGLP